MELRVERMGSNSFPRINPRSRMLSRESIPPHNPSLGDALAPPYSSIYLSGLHGRGPRHSNGIELSPFSHTPPSVPTCPHRFPSARPSRPHTPAGVPSCIPPPPGAWHFDRRLPPPPRHLGTGQKARFRDETLILRHRAITRRQCASIGTRPRSRRRTAPARGSTGPSRHPVAPAAPAPGAALLVDGGAPSRVERREQHGRHPELPREAHAARAGETGARAAREPRARLRSFGVFRLQ